MSHAPDRAQRAPAPPTWPSIARASSQIGGHPPRLGGQDGEDAPLLRVGTIFVAGENVVVSGAISGEMAAEAVLEINGERTPLADSGSFCASVSRAGRRVLTLVLETKTHELIALRIPLDSGAVRARSAPARQLAGERPRRLSS